MKETIDFGWIFSLTLILAVVRLLAWVISLTVKDVNIYRSIDINPFEAVLKIVSVFFTNICTACLIIVPALGYSSLVTKNVYAMLSYSEFFILSVLLGIIASIASVIREILPLPISEEKDLRAIKLMHKIIFVFSCIVDIFILIITSYGISRGYL